MEYFSKKSLVKRGLYLDPAILYSFSKLEFGIYSKNNMFVSKKSCIFISHCSTIDLFCKTNFSIYVSQDYSKSHKLNFT